MHSIANQGLPVGRQAIRTNIAGLHDRLATKIVDERRFLSVSYNCPSTYLITRGTFKLSIKIKKMHLNIRLSIFCLLIFGAGSLWGQEAFRKTAPKAGPAPKIELGTFDQFQLDNGLKVIVVENHKIPRVSFQVFVDRPPIFEGAKAGYVSIAGQMLDKGTTTKTKAEIDETIDFVGGSLFTSSTGVFASCLTKHKDVVLDLMSDVLFNPSFPEEEFEKIKLQTISNLAAEKENPSSISRVVSGVLTYGKDHPYGESETEETIEQVTLDDCKAYYNTYMKPNWSYLTVVGDITTDEVRSIADKYFASWEKGEIEIPSFTMPSPPSQTQVAFVDRPSAVQSVINITYPIDLKPGHPDDIKSQVMNLILGGGSFGNRLFQNLREDKGYTYGASSSVRKDRLVGSFRAGADVRNEVTDSAIVEFMNELKRMATEAVSDEELEFSKSFMTGAFSRQLERPQTVATYALNIARYNLPADYYATFLEKLNALTKEDIMEVSQKFIKPENAHIVVVGNKSEVAENLVKLAPSGKVNFYDRSGNPIEEMDNTIPEGVNVETVLENYLNAIGGAEKLSAVKNLTTISKGSIMQQDIISKTILGDPNQLLTEMSVGGNVMQKIVFDGEAGSMEMQGQKMDLPPPAVEAMKGKSIFPEVTFLSNIEGVKLAGKEQLDGVPVYKVEANDQAGNSTTLYFNIETGLKIKQVETMMGMSQTTEYEDYKEVDGIKFPHKLTNSGGGMPMALVMEVIEIKVNDTLSEDTFKK